MNPNRIGGIGIGMIIAVPTVLINLNINNINLIFVIYKYGLIIWVGAFYSLTNIP